jgi:hypothetical protein
MSARCKIALKATLSVNGTPETPATEPKILHNTQKYFPNLLKPFQYATRNQTKSKNKKPTLNKPKKYEGGRPIFWQVKKRKKEGKLR